jgi:hypothetical protein
LELVCTCCPYCLYRILELGFEASNQGSGVAEQKLSLLVGELASFAAPMPCRSKGFVRPIALGEARGPQHQEFRSILNDVDAAIDRMSASGLLAPNPGILVDGYDGHEIGHVYRKKAWRW